MVLRGTLEGATHPWTLRRRLPHPFNSARIYASSEGGLRYLRLSLEHVDPMLLSLVAEIVRPGDIVWDIGANVGLFSFASSVAAGPSGRVLAVEPDSLLVRMLRRSAATNPGHAPVDVIPVAVSDVLDISAFHIARRNRSTSHLDGFGTSQTGGVRTTELVPTVTLDWLAARFSRPDVIKIDVEGAELKVLAGAADVLQMGPTLICEVAGDNEVSVSDVLTGYGYSLYDGECSIDRRTLTSVASHCTLAISGSRRRGPAGSHNGRDRRE